VLDGVTQNYNIGAIFRLCDAFLVRQLVICDTKLELRKLVQAAQGTQHWVPGVRTISQVRFAISAARSPALVDNSTISRSR
jgi:tRNA G18 (ribose-2'-O)-methylase SpoU